MLVPSSTLRGGVKKGCRVLLKDASEENVPVGGRTSEACDLSRKTCTTLFKLINTNRELNVLT